MARKIEKLVEFRYSIIRSFTTPISNSIQDIKGGLGTLTSVARNKDAMNKAVDITTA